MSTRTIKPEVQKLLHAGTVIPAHPLALDSQRKLDEKRQRGYDLDIVACGGGVLPQIEARTKPPGGLK